MQVYNLIKPQYQLLTTQCWGVGEAQKCLLPMSQYEVNWPCMPLSKRQVKAREKMSEDSTKNGCYRKGEIER